MDKVASFFEFEARGTSLKQEFVGSLATFLTMAYILAVNPAILSDSGGPCEYGDGGPFSDQYFDCKFEIKKQYITATAIASMVGCIIMGLMANLPVALAPGMGLNAYFTFSVVGFHGFGSVSYSAAVTAILIEGFIFLALALSGTRMYLTKLIPEPVKYATPAAIGAFLAHLGMQTAEGVGVVVSDIATAVTLGGCPAESRVSMVALTDSCKENWLNCVTSDAYTCDEYPETKMQGATTWLGISGLVIIAILLSYKKTKSIAFVVGVIFVSVISWIPDTDATLWTDDDRGQAKFDYFKQVVSIEKMSDILAPFTSDLKSVGVALVTFLYVDFLDTSGTLLALVDAMGLTDENGDFPKSRWAFSADAIATIVGSCFGLSPVTSYIESAAGVEAGSRTGLTAIFCGFYFFLSIFFAPIIASIPAWGIGGALIIVGSLMARSLSKVKWHIPSHAISAFLTVMVMPLTYSIAYGLIAGIVIYLVMEGTFLLLSFVGIEKPSYEEAEEEPAEEEEPAKEEE